MDHDYGGSERQRQRDGGLFRDGQCGLFAADRHDQCCGSNVHGGAGRQPSHLLTGYQQRDFFIKRWYQQCCIDCELFVDGSVQRELDQQHFTRKWHRQWDNQLFGGRKYEHRIAQRLDSNFGRQLYGATNVDGDAKRRFHELLTFLLELKLSGWWRFDQRGFECKLLMDLAK